MATDALPARASSTSIAEASWFRFLVRAVLVVLAFLMLRLAADQLRTLSLGRSVSLQLDTTLWLESIGSTVAAGLLFGLATWLPFTSVRLLPSRLVLAVVALLPVAHFWWGFRRRTRDAGWMARIRLLVRQCPEPVRFRCPRGSGDRVRIRDETLRPVTGLADHVYGKRG
jgi:hypothetical protein